MVKHNVRRLQLRLRQPTFGGLSYQDAVLATAIKCTFYQLACVHWAADNVPQMTTIKAHFDTIKCKAVLYRIVIKNTTNQGYQLAQAKRSFFFQFSWTKKIRVIISCARTKDQYGQGKLSSRLGTKRETGQRISREMKKRYTRLRSSQRSSQALLKNLYDFETS